MTRRKRTRRDIPAKGRLRDMCDKLWSLAIRADWDHSCAVCGHTKTEAHHLVPRQHEATRYDMMNGIALCSRHHQFDPDTSPHQNAAGWCAWLASNYPLRLDWYLENRRPVFCGTKNNDYYIGILRRLQDYVEPGEFARIVGVRFGAWLENHWKEYDSGKTDPD